jgi:hypothetical protein
VEVVAVHDHDVDRRVGERSGGRQATETGSDDYDTDHIVILFTITRPW